MRCSLNNLVKEKRTSLTQKKKKKKAVRAMRVSYTLDYDPGAMELESGLGRWS